MKKEMEPPQNNENEGAEERTAEQGERRTRAEAIAQSGSYTRMLEEFTKVPGLFEEMTEDLKRREAFLSVEAPYLSERDWKILTCLELFDRATFEHCERTWALAKEKLESPALVGIHFRGRLAREGLSVENVLRACILHDCGKMCLDKQILNDAHTDAEWKMANERFCTRVYGAEEGGRKVAELNDYLDEHPGHRAIHKVPYEAVAELGERERQAVAEMNAKGIDSSLPLAALIETHQDRSGEILAAEENADPAIALVANHHPRGPIANEEHPTGLSIVRAGATLSTEFGLALDIVRLSDIFDAYHSARVYKPGHPNLAALEYLMCEADRGNIDPTDAEEWVKDSVVNLDKEKYFSHLALYVEQEEKSGTRSEADLRKLEELFAEEKIAHDKLEARGIITS